MSDHAEIIREAFRYAQGFDVAGWPAHLRDDEVSERFNAALKGLLADHAAETERLRDLLREAECVIFEGVREDAPVVTGCESWREVRLDSDEVRWRIMEALGMKPIDYERFLTRIGAKEKAERERDEARAENERLTYWLTRAKAGLFGSEVQTWAFSIDLMDGAALAAAQEPPAEFRGWDGSVKSSVGFGASSEMTVKALKRARSALAAAQEPPADDLGLSPFWNSPTGEGEMDDRCDDCFAANADHCPHRQQEPPAESKSDIYRRQAEQARASLDTSPAWVRDRATPPRQPAEGGDRDA